MCYISIIDMLCCLCHVDIGDREQLKSLMSELKVLIHVGSHLNILNLLGAVTTEISVGQQNSL